MRVAVLADIHGNLPALEAVLRDVGAVGADAVVLNGDIADGPMPGQTLDRLEELGERAIWVRGNTDRSLAAAFDGTFQPSGLPANPPADYFTWCAARIGQAHRDRLASLPLTVTLDIDGLGPVAFCHGTARDDNEFILVDSPVELYQAGSPASSSRRSFSGTLICRSTVSLIHGASSTPARSACPTAMQGQRGRCSDRM